MKPMNTNMSGSALGSTAHVMPAHVPSGHLWQRLVFILALRHDWPSTTPFRFNTNSLPKEK